MPIRSTTKSTRPNTSVAWYESSSDFKAYVKSTYEDTNKKTAVATDNKKNTTVWTVTTEFADATAKSEWDNDSAVKTMLAERRAHNRANNILFERSVENV